MMMRLTSDMSFATASTPLGAASSSSSSPSIMDNKQKMKERINHALSRKEARKYERYFD